MTEKIVSMKDHQDDMTRQQRRAAMKKLDKEQKQILKDRERPVKMIEFLGMTRYLETTIAVMDSFLESKFGDDYSNFIKDQMNKEKEKLGIVEDEVEASADE